MSATDTLIARYEDVLIQLKALQGKTKGNFGSSKEIRGAIEKMGEAIELARAECDALASGNPRMVLVIEDGVVDIFSDKPLNLEILKLDRDLDAEDVDRFTADAVMVDPNRVNKLYREAEESWASEDDVPSR